MTTGPKKPDWLTVFEVRTWSSLYLSMTKEKACSLHYDKKAGKYSVDVRWGSPQRACDNRDNLLHCNQPLLADAQAQVNCCYHVSSAASVKDWTGLGASLPTIKVCFMYFSHVLWLVPSTHPALMEVREPRWYYATKEAAGIKWHSGRLDMTVPLTQFGSKAMEGPYSHRPF